MDQVMVSLPSSRNIPDKATVFGTDNKKEIRLEKIAAQLNTIPYELLCSIGQRTKRIYIK